MLETATLVEKKNEPWASSFGLRWALLYFALYAPVPGRLLSFLSPYQGSSARATGAWFAHRFGFHVPLAHQDFLIVGLEALAMAPLACIWTLFDRRERSNAVVREIAYLLARFSLAGAMFGYGAAKVIGYQGVYQPAPIDWLRPVGELTPGFVMWMWLGYSRVFESFAGVNELLGGFLLLFRRTALLGALIVLPVMLFVTTMDLTFDVGPQVLAAQLAFAALYVVAMQRQRLAGAFLFGKASTPPSSTKVWNSGWLKLAKSGIWIVLVANFCWHSFGWHIKEDFDLRGGQSALCGAYRVERFESDGRVIPENPADPTRWREVAISRFGDYIRVRRIDDADLLWAVFPERPIEGQKFGDSQKYLARTSGTQGQIELRPLLTYHSAHAKLAESNPDQSFTLRFFRTGGGHVLLEGRIDGAEISADLQKIDNRDFAFTRSQTLWP